MFTIEERDGIRDRILAIAHADPRIVAGAMIGSLTQGPGDRWSDLDLGFGVGDGATPAEVLADWTPRLARECRAVHLFDLASGAAIYRVFLFPGALQVDLSFAPAAEFGARGPKFKVLFGTAVERPRAEPPSASHLFGVGVHHAVRARFCVERGRLWQAQHWIGELREIGLTLASRRRGLETAQGRGYDELPPRGVEAVRRDLGARPRSGRTPAGAPRRGRRAVAGSRRSPDAGGEGRRSIARADLA